jgi:hypothetical protein
VWKWGGGLPESQKQSLLVVARREFHMQTHELHIGLAISLLLLSSQLVI